MSRAGFHFQSRPGAPSELGCMALSIPGAPLRYTPGCYQTRLRRLRAHILGRHQNRVERIRQTVPNPAFLRAIPPWFKHYDRHQPLFPICHFCLANLLNYSIPPVLRRSLATYSEFAGSVGSPASSRQPQLQ